MPRTIPVNDDHFASVLGESLSDLAADLHNLSDRIRKEIGWADDVKRPHLYLRRLTGLNRSVTELIFLMELKLANDEAELMGKANG